nr:PREDICTED: elongation of very long chain fatty acids protein AAEL008004-like isoform X1 [Linepithema humile]XP_012231543.1 PREDICTED: elongation of very long chain fatty acids protein AAEL008004-like isoform X1 [Linepithema humile]XP_012231544.1 PREDICTED: elongation of very long chain fatty acids protein AAEL008004-like isoform X1 [Linepithema humile]XP_012231545.1 PREDICTED: elongation of very long chain fatty acids protein AAEL008004-like isoform X1 [Linepithema humile]
MGLGEIYNYWLIDLSNPLTREWPLLSLYSIIFIILGYTYFVLYAGPCYMKNRQPYNLKNFILFYNIIQILANTWLVKEHISAGWFSKYSVTCQPSEPTSPSAIRLINLVWWIYLLKMFDLVETCVFVLRKKQNQVSTLHVYHHASNLSFLWYYLKYVVDERGTLLTLVNCAVHVIMYIYYFFAAWSPQFQQMLYSIKPFITKMQMVQFIVLILYILQAVFPTCESNVKFTLVPIFIGNLLIFLYLFNDFYKKSYTKAPKQMNS